MDSHFNKHALFSSEYLESWIENALKIHGEEGTRALVREDSLLWRSLARESHAAWAKVLMSVSTETYVRDEDIVVAAEWANGWGVDGYLHEAESIAPHLGLPSFFKSRLEKQMIVFLASGIGFRHTTLTSNTNLGLSTHEKLAVQLTSQLPESKYPTELFSSMEAILIAASHYYAMQTKICEHYTRITGKAIEARDVGEIGRQMLQYIVKAATKSKKDYHIGFVQLMWGENPLSFARDQNGKLIVEFNKLPEDAEKLFNEKMGEMDPDFLEKLNSEQLHTGCPSLRIRMEGGNLLTTVVRILAMKAQKDLLDSSYPFAVPRHLSLVPHHP